MTLKLGRGLEFPDDAVTQAIGILAKRGAGKSNAGAVLAEEMHAAGLPFVVVDPVGAWWGLRSSGDGKGAGLPIPIFGGYRGDVPLEPQGGALIADLIVDENLSAVLDVSGFDSENSKRRFLWTFAERLYYRKGKPGNDTPLHLFLEEADDYIPQRATGEVARCLGAFERIVKRGRARGLGVTMITQRSAALNKDVLTQIETLIVLRTTSPQDIAAIGLWVKYHGQSEEILSSLAELKPGEAWVYSPWLDLTDRFQIRRRRTFDSGATPSVKAKRAVATLADVDIDAITVQMAETLERAKADDPTELRRRIRELERTVTDIQKQTVTAKPVIERVEVRVAHVPPALLDAITKAVGTFGATSDAIRDMADTLQREATHAAASVAAEDGSAPEPSRGRSAGSLPAPVAPTPTPAIRHGETANAPGPVSTELTTPQRRVLDAIAWLANVGIEPASRLQVAMIAGYHPRSKGFTNSLGTMSTGGQITYPSPGLVEMTNAGRSLAEWPVSAGDSEQLQQAIYQQVGERKARFLRELVARYPDPISRDDLAAALDYHPRSKGFTNSLGSLRTLGLIDYPMSGTVVATPLMFLEVAA